MSLNVKLPVIKRNDLDIWGRIAAELPEPASLDENMGVWAQIGYFTGGVWSQLGEETLILDGCSDSPQGVWESSDEETLIIKREPGRDLWESTENLAKNAILAGVDDLDLWEQLDDETLLLPRSETSVWTAPRIRDVSTYQPARALGWALKGLTTSKGEPYWVLKNLRQGTYLRLTEHQVDMWNLMDGCHSIQDLAVANFLKYQIFSYDSLMGFLGQLHARGLLATADVDVYQQMSMQLRRRGLNYWIKRLIGLLIGSEWSLTGVDRFYAAFYRLVGWVLFTRPVLLGLWLVSIFAIPAYFYISQVSDLSFVLGSSASLGLGLVGLWFAQLFAVLTHESAHALTTKHYGRKLRRGGVGLYFGMLVFFMDTTDIWMEPRRPRLAVTWAGPLSGFFLCGLACLSLLLYPSASLAGQVYQFATFCFALSILNLNPLLKLDGYYILMDWLEMPMLREKSLNFVQGDLWRRLVRREQFDKDERIFAIFGILALAWTVFVLYSLFRLLGGVTLHYLQVLLGPGWGFAVTLILILALVAVLLQPYLRAFLAGRKS